MLDFRWRKPNPLVCWGITHQWLGTEGQAQFSAGSRVSLPLPLFPSRGHRKQKQVMLLGRLRKLGLDISVDEAIFERRGFPALNAPARPRLERSGRSFIEGYLVAVEAGQADPVPARLESIALDLRGFAFEGAAMGLAVLDGLTPWRPDRLERFIEG